VAQGFPLAPPFRKRNFYVCHERVTRESGAFLRRLGRTEMLRQECREKGYAGKEPCKVQAQRRREVRPWLASAARLRRGGIARVHWPWY